MSRRDATHFHQVLKINWKVIMVIIAFWFPLMVYHGREEGEKIFKIFLKDSHHDRQIMSRRDAEDDLYWK